MAKDDDMHFGEGSKCWTQYHSRLDISVDLTVNTTQNRT
jgi:hypothetical protein